MLSRIDLTGLSNFSDLCRLWGDAHNGAAFFIAVAPRGRTRLVAISLCCRSRDPETE
jgi:hypothetical protein